MPFHWPSFVRRRLALHRARRAISAGEHAQALDHLRDPSLAGESRARELRERALGELCRAASLAIASGDEAGARAALALVSSEDPRRGIAWGRRLALADRSHGEPSARPLVRLLEEMRAQKRAGESDGRASQNGAARANGVAAHQETMSETPRTPATLRFHVEIDDGGELLAVASDRVVIGHLRSSAADLRFLADVEAEHARLVRRDSFHSGPSWQIERVEAREVRVNGRAIDAASVGLFDGDEVVLARNLAFRFREPQATSQSAVLELSRGAECEGALRILLFAPGESGIVRIGSKRDRHIPLADIEHEISLKLSGGELWVHCAGGVERAGADSSTTLSVACPPAEPQHLSCRARAQGRAPLWISLRPLSHSQERA